LPMLPSRPGRLTITSRRCGVGRVVSRCDFSIGLRAPSSEAPAHLDEHDQRLWYLDPL
jgi:hypothetical protein